MHRWIAASLIGAVVSLSAPPADAATVTISCGSVGSEEALCRSAARDWAAMTGHHVEVYASPTSSSDRLALYERMLESGGGNVDVFQIDVIWPGVLGGHFVDLRLFFEASDVDAHFEGIVAGLSRGDALLAMPWFTDAPMLYHRTDLLEKYGLSVPETWDEVTIAARVIQDGERAAGNDRFWGFVWQGKAYEGLTCNALEWINSHGGGAIVEPDGQVSINNPAAVRALELARSWVGTISPAAVLDFQEDDTLGVFQTGNAAFMRNWPYAYAEASKPDSAVAGRFDVAPLPKGGADGRSAATLGGWQLAVSRYSEHPEIAAELVRYLTSYDMQKARAIAGSFAPTYPALYRDPDVLAANPFFGRLHETLLGAVARPSAVAGERYDDLSRAFFDTVHATLSGDGDATANLAALERRLRRLSRGGRW